MKRFLAMILVLAAFALPTRARADQPPFAMLSSSCATSPDFGFMPFCFDTTSGSYYFWNGTAFVGPAVTTGAITATGASKFNAGAANQVPITVKGFAAQSSDLQDWDNSTPAVLASVNSSGQFVSGLGGTQQGAFTINGATSGSATITTIGAAGTAFNYILPTSAGAVGSLLTSGNTSQQVWLADGATGTILTGAGVTTIPAFSATPTISGTLIDQTSVQVSVASADLALATTNGGHYNSLKGSASLPTVGTGTVTAGGSDNAMNVTGATSPVTVTFQTAFGASPICVCNDVTSALGACKAVVSSGAAVVVTTTGTDSFNLICIGK